MSLQARQWILRPGIEFRFDAKDIVELFLNATARWYDDPTNELYGRRANVAYLLTKYLETGTEPDNLQHGLIYALYKFQREWLEHGNPNSMFIETEEYNDR